MTTTRDWFIEQDKLFMHYPSCTYVIGGAYGIHESAKTALFSQCRGLSPLTFPHAMALLVLFEQLYRINEIKK